MGDIEAGQQSDGAPLLQQGNDSAAATGAQQPAAAAAPGQPQNTPMCACLTISYYRPVRCGLRAAGLFVALADACTNRWQHFDVDTSDVVARLRKAVTPVAGENSLLAEVHAKPDLYGPFWVCTTLIFVIGASANFASWVYWDKVLGAHLRLALVGGPHAVRACGCPGHLLGVRLHTRHVRDGPGVRLRGRFACACMGRHEVHGRTDKFDGLVVPLWIQHGAIHPRGGALCGVCAWPPSAVLCAHHACPALRCFARLRSRPSIGW